MAAQVQDASAITKRNAVDVVAARVRQFQESGELNLPANYSAENALKAAWLTLQTTVDRNKQPALQVCTKESVANALLDMVVQGLNPAKKQAYFVVYGNQLLCMRSYFGSMALVKRVLPEAEIYYSAVYAGDELEYEVVRGRRMIIKHTQKLEHVKPDKVVAAYCVIEPGGNRPAYTEIMTIDQIRQAWAQGQSYKDGGSGTHQKFPDQMAIKTVVNRACKAVINSSSDDYLLLNHANRSDDEVTEIEIHDEIAANANGRVIDIEPSAPDAIQEASTADPQGQSANGMHQASLVGPGF